MKTSSGTPRSSVTVLGQGNTHGRYGDARDEGEKHGRLDSGAGAVPVPGADAAGDDDVGTKSEARVQIDDEADGRDIVAGGGHGFLADKASQHEDVGCGEELLEEARERDRESENKHFAGNGTMEHVHVP